MRLREGLTLVEVLIVVLILGALSAIAVPRLSRSAATAKNRACAANIERMNSQIELYQHDTGSWPAALTDVTEKVQYFGGEDVLCPFGEPYVLDHSRHRVIMHEHAGEVSAGTDGGGGGGSGGGGSGWGRWGRGGSGGGRGWQWGWSRGRGRGLQNRPDAPGQGNSGNQGQDQGQGNSSNPGQGQGNSGNQGQGQGNSGNQGQP